jgi:hypothetical protein
MEVRIYLYLIFAATKVAVPIHNFQLSIFHFQFSITFSLQPSTFILHPSTPAHTLFQSICRASFLPLFNWLIQCSHLGNGIKDEKPENLKIYFEVITAEFADESKVECGIF